MKLCFLGAENLPACRVHVRTVFKHFFVVHLVASGSFYFQRGIDRHIEVEKPLFFWTDRTSSYAYGPGVTGSWDHHWISFRGDWADSYYQTVLEELAPAGFVPVYQADQLKASFLKLIVELNASGNTLASGVHGLNHLLGAIHEERRFFPHDQDPIASIKAVFDAQPEGNHSLPGLATTHGLSYSHFRKSFRERYHEPPHRYLLRQRMQKAAQLLTQLEVPINQVGLAMNYQDPARFSRVFKDHFGLSPRSYREAICSR